MNVTPFNVEAFGAYLDQAAASFDRSLSMLGAAMREAAQRNELAARKLLASADRSRGVILRLFNKAFREGRQALDLTTVEILCGSGFEQSLNSYLERALTATEQHLIPSRLPAALLLTMKRAADAANHVKASGKTRAAKKTAAAPKLKILPRFDASNPAAIDWAQAHAAQLVTEVNDEARKAIQKLIAKALRQGIAPRDLSRILVKTVSMTEAQANAVVNLHQAIITSPGKVVYAGKVKIRVPAAGMDSARVDKLLQAYADRLTRQRAIMIARTEVIAAANEGQTLLWKQAQEKGLLPATIRHTWIAAQSERTCPVCTALDGETVVVGEMFSTGVTNPPAHPMCRCSTGLA